VQYWNLPAGSLLKIRGGYAQLTMHACRWQIAALERRGQEMDRRIALQEGERTRQTVEIAGCCMCCMPSHIACSCACLLALHAPVHAFLHCMLLCIPTCCHNTLQDSHADFFLSVCPKPRTRHRKCIPGSHAIGDRARREEKTSARAENGARREGKT
jgi:hypothetical protein